MTDKELEKFIRKIVREELAAFVDSAKPAEHRSLEAEAKRHKDAAGNLVKGYLDMIAGEPIVDGECGWTAEWLYSKTMGDFDYAHMPDAAILMMARAGCFKAEAQAALAMIAKKDPEIGALIKKHQMGEGERRRLSVVNALGKED